MDLSAIVTFLHPSSQSSSLLAAFIQSLHCLSKSLQQVPWKYTIMLSKPHYLWSINRSWTLDVSSAQLQCWFIWALQLTVTSRCLSPGLMESKWCTMCSTRGLEVSNLTLQCSPKPFLCVCVCVCVCRASCKTNTQDIITQRTDDLT